jgi:uncharacterized protein involved in type VI secretion and phage assembly
VTHRIDGSGFTTSFSISQRSTTSLLGLLRKQVVDEPAPHRPEPFYGVVVGKVEANHESAAVPPAAPLGRVKVSFPGMSDRFVSNWAPCARPMGGKGTGFYALPEVGEQVLVAFECGDLGKPYILGTLWSVDQGPPATNSDGLNNTRVLKSRSGHTITFNDSKTGSSLVITDAGGSSITFDSSKNSMTISAVGELTLKAARGKTTISMTESGVDVK